MIAMTPDEARHWIIEGLNYAAYRETDSSLHDTDKNRLRGSEHYNSGRHIANPSPWAEGDFEEKMTVSCYAGPIFSTATFQNFRKLKSFSKMKTPFSAE